LIGHDSLLLVLSQFLLFLLGIHELIPGDATRIKPLQKGIRVSGFRFPVPPM
jgi:hypothetical protein